MTIRISGGELNSRLLQTNLDKTLKPTTNFLRQVLFNWLGLEVHGAHILDLCAGSGAIGIEALSRGASHATFVEKQSMLCKGIEDNCRNFKIEQTKFEVVCLDVISYCERVAKKYHVVFIDPPYSEHALIPQCIDALIRSESLTHQASIICETYAKTPPFQSAFVKMLKRKQTNTSALTLYMYLA
ncbi:MAG: 16S rRNA (guanine(966)-N(2))-methyltransferase RsmD [Methylacidiphilales bacterium]|nr:16S rRNA (guanine(966)-N(2))-methyltransferase RsmD [Candidatus Methylacidiphilales bacterium]